jgi:4-alpha-glucanotransferase
MPFPRASGILLHPTSFPSSFGIGDLGPGAYRFIDFLADSGQKFWQVLPLVPTGYGNSPYMSYSALAGNPLLISPEELRQKGLLVYEDLADVPEFPLDKADFEPAAVLKLDLLQKAWERFQTQPQEEFIEFCEQKAGWLDDFALFMAVKQANNNQSWNQWEPGIAKREPEAIKTWQNSLAAEISFQKYLQFEFFRQWSYIKNYAHSRGIEIIGDIPIYVAHDSADVWANPHLFCLHPETGAATLVAGVPPDYFSATGQLWGNPIYNWYAMRRENYAWWVKRFAALLELVDWIRIDHFRAFESYWAVKGDEKTAINGRWIKGPRSAFFKSIEQQLGRLPIVAEDLGDITPPVIDLLNEFGFAGMKILQFAFGSGSGNPYLPHGFVRNCIVYTGTHDNDTTAGWFAQLSESQQESVRDYLGRIDEEDIAWDLIRAALSSVADWAIFPLQDVLGLGTAARMNTPGTSEGNWSWRYQSESLTGEIGDRLRKLTETYGRIPS